MGTNFHENYFLGSSVKKATFLALLQFTDKAKRHVL